MERESLFHGILRRHVNARNARISAFGHKTLSLDRDPMLQHSSLHVLDLHFVKHNLYLCTS